MDVARAVQEYIKERGIKQSFIADKCGWSKQKTSAIIRGERRMIAEEMANICEAVGVPYDFFYQEASNDNKPA